MSCLAPAQPSAKKPLMLPIHSRPVAAALALALIGPLAACAGNRNRTAADTQYVASDVATLYNTARDMLDRGRYTAAAALFDEVERQHP